MLTLKEHLSRCTALSSLDNPNLGSYLLASGSTDTNIKLWDLRQKSSINTLRAHDKPINDVKISGSTSGSFNDLYVVSSSTD